MAQRTREIGIRIALGADRRRVLSLILREGGLLAVAGAGLGLAAALAATRVLRGMLFGVTTTDPWTYVAMIAVLAAAALMASWLPARRAARVDPMVAIRSSWSRRPGLYRSGCPLRALLLGVPIRVVLRRLRLLCCRALLLWILLGPPLRLLLHFGLPVDANA